MQLEQVIPSKNDGKKSDENMTKIFMAWLSNIFVKNFKAIYVGLQASD